VVNIVKTLKEYESGCIEEDIYLVVGEPGLGGEAAINF